MLQLARCSGKSLPPNVSRVYLSFHSSNGFIQLPVPRTETLAFTHSLLSKDDTPIANPHSAQLGKSSKYPQNAPLLPPNAAAAAASAAVDSGLKFREKLVYLQFLKVNPTKALYKNPNIRSAPLKTLRSITQCLASMGLECSAISRVLDMYPQLLTSDPYVDIYPIFDFLLNVVEIPFPELRKTIIRCPRLLVSNPETQLKPTFEFLTELGFAGSNKFTSQTTLLLVSSLELTLKPKIEYLMGLGLDYNDVRNMVLRSPGLLTFSIENNYRPKVEYFLNEMNGDLEELKRFPQYFSFSLERKIKPRHQLLVEYGFSISLSDMLKVSDGEFSLRLIEGRLRMVDEREY